MNYGRVTKQFTVVNLPQAMELIRKIRKTGRIVRIDFQKRSDGKMRTMICRTGVSLYTTGGVKKKAPTFADKGLLPVFEFGHGNKGYRSVPIENITGIKFDGEWYDFRDLNGFANHSHAKGQAWMAHGFSTEYRTKQAYTSPLYTN